MLSGDNKVLLSIQLENIVGLDSAYYEVFTRLMPRVFLLSLEQDLTKEISLLLYEVLSERGAHELLLEQSYCLMLNSITLYYEELVDLNQTLLHSICSTFYITNILYSGYTDEHITVIVEGYRVC